MSDEFQFNQRELVTVAKCWDGFRLDQCAAEAFECIPSRKSAYKAVKRGCILVNGKSSQPNYLVCFGEELIFLEKRITFPEFHLKLKVILDDDYLAVIEKPPGYPVNGNHFRTIENALSLNLSPSNASDALPHPLPVHRLDVPTGGLLLVAKSRKSLVELGRQFQWRLVKKQYHALVIGRLENQGEISESINGKVAKSTFKGIEYTRSLHTEWVTTVELAPETGRTHQLRKHLASIGHPIVGDKLYGEENKIFRGKGLFLWAVALEFTHPILGKKLSISIEEPHKFRSYKKREARRWNRYNLIKDGLIR